jgi:hypothetical protein
MSGPYGMQHLKNLRSLQKLIATLFEEGEFTPFQHFDPFLVSIDDGDMKSLVGKEQRERQPYVASSPDNDDMKVSTIMHIP